MDLVIPKGIKLCLTKEYGDPLSFFLSFCLSFFIVSLYLSMLVVAALSFKLIKYYLYFWEKRWKKIRICITDLGHFIR